MMICVGKAAATLALHCEQFSFTFDPETDNVKLKLKGFAMLSATLLQAKESLRGALSTWGKHLQQLSKVEVSIK